MKQQLASVALLVRDYDEALTYYTTVLGFQIVEDIPLREGKRWVLIRPMGSQACSLLLAQAKNEEERQAIGKQSGGRVFLFLETDDFARDYQVYRGNGVDFLEEPRQEAYGTVAVFRDLYGNKWDLIERKSVEMFSAANTEA
jgi:catechol 2,3-dioxygenase-like lactoylglutathione lyase family enzyme